MPTASRPTFLRHFGRPAPRGGPDLADMGTAFALDEALDQQSLDAMPEPRLAKAVPVAPWRLWLGRKLGA